VGPDVADRVRRAARQLNYRPDAVARSLRLQATRTLGLVVADITNPFFPPLVQAIEHESRVAGLSLLLADAQGDIDVERREVELLLDNRVDGLLISPSHRFLSVATVELASRSVPVVQLDRVASQAVAFVRVDQAEGIGQLVEHLREAGRRHLGFIGSDPSISTSWERQEAFVALAGRDDPSASVRVLAGDFTVGWGRVAARRMVSLWPETDAIVCANDLIALGAQQALAEDSGSGARPVAVTGFDDTIIASAVGITSVRQPLRELAAHAVRMCLASQHVLVAPQQVSLSAELIVRGSTA
jgi:LacI family transcriptional regulator